MVIHLSKYICILVGRSNICQKYMFCTIQNNHKHCCGYYQNGLFFATLCMPATAVLLISGLTPMDSALIVLYLILSQTLSWLRPEWLIFCHALHTCNSCVTYRRLSTHGLCLDRVLSYLITDIVARLDNNVAHYALFFHAITCSWCTSCLAPCAAPHAMSTGPTHSRAVLPCVLFSSF